MKESICCQKVKKGDEIRAIGIQMLDDGYYKFTIEMTKDADIEDLARFKDAFSNMIDFLNKM